MGALRATIPGEGGRTLTSAVVPLTRIAQARSDLSPSGRGDASRESARVRIYVLKHSTLAHGRLWQGFCTPCANQAARG